MPVSVERPLPEATYHEIAREIFILLLAEIALGGRNVSEEQLIDVLWPEADGDLAHLSLAATLHRLRRLLGSDDALRLSRGRVSLDRSHCWVDAWGFQRIAGEAVNLWKKERGDGSTSVAADGRVGEAIALSEKAVGLYKGGLPYGRFAISLGAADAGTAEREICPAHQPLGSVL